jgi:NADH-quinone oxidoreductase subunit M
MDNLLSIVTFLPLVAALIMAVFLRGDDEAAQRNAKRLAFAPRSATFLVSIFILVQFDPGDTGFQLVEETRVALGLQYKVGVDGISVLFVMLTTFLMPITIAACWGVTHRVKEYMIAFLVLETLMIGVFVALDLVLFYLFFEAGLIPMFLIIGIWGGKDRIYASFKFFLYTFLGSVLMLVAMVAMYVDAGTTDIERCWRTSSRPRLSIFWAGRSWAACRRCCGSPSSRASRSRCRCGRCTPGCPTPTCRRPRRARSCWRRSC